MTTYQDKPLTITDLTTDDTEICDSDQIANVTFREPNLLQPKKKIIKKESEKEKEKEKIRKAEKCAICIDVVNKQYSKTNCGHVFCLTCLHEHLKTNHTCPLCRKEILDEKPKKPILEVKREKAIEMINDELDDYDLSSLLDKMISFPNNAKDRIKCLMQEYGLELADKFIHAQHYEDDEYDEDIEDDYSYGEDSYS